MSSISGLSNTPNIPEDFSYNTSFAKGSVELPGGGHATVTFYYSIKEGSTLNESEVKSAWKEQAANLIEIGKQLDHEKTSYQKISLDLRERNVTILSNEKGGLKEKLIGVWGNSGFTRREPIETTEAEKSGSSSIYGRRAEFKPANEVDNLSREINRIQDVRRKLRADYLEKVVENSGNIEKLNFLRNEFNISDEEWFNLLKEQLIKLTAIANEGNPAAQQILQNYSDRATREYLSTHYRAHVETAVSLYAAHAKAGNATEGFKTEVLVLIEEMKSEDRGVLPPKEMKRLQKALANQYGWDSGFRPTMNEGLTLPSNWTISSHLTIHWSQSGKAYISTTKQEPILRVDGEGVPSGMRKHKDYEIFPTNLFKTTHSVYNDQGKSIKEHTSYRGGLFQTEKSAGAVLSAIDKPKVWVIGLLTAMKAGPSGADRNLLRNHSSNMKNAKGECEVRFINSGVSAHAIGQRGKFGWHTNIIENMNPHIEEIKNDTIAKMKELVDSDDLEDKKQLAAITTVLLRIDQIWTTNEFTSGDKGFSMYELPALLIVLADLIEVESYTHCMSGKDRTGQVSAMAELLLDEIIVNLSEKSEEEILALVFIGKELCKGEEANRLLPKKELIANRNLLIGDFGIRRTASYISQKKLEENGALLLPNLSIHTHNRQRMKQLAAHKAATANNITRQNTGIAGSKSIEWKNFSYDREVTHKELLKECDEAKIKKYMALALLSAEQADEIIRDIKEAVSSPILKERRLYSVLDKYEKWVKVGFSSYPSGMAKS